MVVTGILVGSSVFSTGKPAVTNEVAEAKTRPYHFEATYGAKSRAEQIAQADAVFVGRVTDVLPARWNQDTGEYWVEEGLTTLPYHEINVNVVRPLFDRIGLEQQIAITVLGGSPAGTIGSAKVPIAPEADHDLKVGDERVFFVSKTSIAWRGGTVGNQATRPVTVLAAYPKYSYLRVEADGLLRSENPEERAITLSELVSRLKNRS